MYSTPSSTGPPRKSTKRRMSEPDLLDRKEVLLVVDDDDDDEPIFLGAASSRGSGEQQLCLGDLWGHQRSDEAGPVGVWKRPRVSKKEEKKTKKKKMAQTQKTQQPITASSSTHIQHQHSSTVHQPNLLSSSVGSPTPSDQRSIFSIDSDSSHSELTDGFTELDLAFNPALFPLETHPIHGIHPSWLEPLKHLLIQPEIISLHQQLGKNYLGYDYKLAQKPPNRALEIAPAPHDLYNWTRLTPLDHIRVVILGPTAHHHADQTHGLAFSQPTTCTRLSGAIRAIHRELAKQYPGSFIRPRHGSLVSWAHAGVLLLNIIQTSQRDKKDAHAKFGWQEFTTRILEIVSRQGGSSYNNNNHHHHQTEDHKLFAPPPPPPPPAHSSNGIVFMGWGEEAIQQIRAAGVASSPRNHKILTSPAAPNASAIDIDGFSDQNHFLLANEFLSATYGPQHAIDWCDLRPLDPYSLLSP